MSGAVSGQGLAELVAAHQRVTADHEAQIRDLLEEREELLTEIRRLREVVAYEVSLDALAEVLTERDAEHEGGKGA